MENHQNIICNTNTNAAVSCLITVFHDILIKRSFRCLRAIGGCVVQRIDQTIFHLRPVLLKCGSIKRKSSSNQHVTLLLTFYQFFNFSSYEMPFRLQLISLITRWFIIQLSIYLLDFLNRLYQVILISILEVGLLMQSFHHMAIISMLFELTLNVVTLGN